MNRSLWILFTVSMGCALLWLIGPVLPPFILGLVMAYLCRPLVCWCKQHFGISMAWSALCITCFLYFLFIVSIILFIPALKSVSFFLSEKISFYRTQLWEMAYPWITKVSSYSKEMTKIQEAIDSVMVLLTNWMGSALMHIVENGLSLARCILTILIAPLIAFHFMKDWTRIHLEMMRLLPHRWRPSCQQLITDMDHALSYYVRGQLIVCLFLSIYYGFFLWCIGLDYGFLLGILTGLSAFIPYLGFLGGLISALLFGLFQYGTGQYCLSTISIFLGGQLLESVLLTPYFIGKKTGMHPVFILFIVFTGGILKGFMGVLFSLPLATLLVATMRFLKPRYERSSFYLKTGKSQ